VNARKSFARKTAQNPFENNLNKCYSISLKSSIVIASNKKAIVEKNSMLVDKI
jgi:hypothetical protein